MPMINPLDLTDRSYLVTGASSGLGRAVAILLSQLGARIILSSRNEKELSCTLEKMENQDNHMISPFDFSKELDEVKEWLSESVSKFSKLNGMVHCSGAYKPLPLKSISERNLLDTFNLNALSAIRLAVAFRNKKISVSSKKSIVFISSVCALAGGSCLSLYSATKGSLVSLTKSLAMELTSENIRVNCISPAFVKTKMTDEFFSKLSKEQFSALLKQHPMGFGEPVDVANAVAFLLADTSKWVTGTNMIVDGGYTAQ